MIEVCMSSDAAILPYAAVVIRSAMERSSLPIRFHIITRGVSEASFSALRSQCPGADINQIPADAIDHGKVNLAPWVKVSTMDRLRITSLLPHARRVIYIDVDTVVVDDLAALLALPTGNCGLSARNSTRKAFWMSDDYARLTHVSIPEDLGNYRNFNAGVLIMDIQKMRACGYEEVTRSIVERTKCNDQIALVLYSKGRHAILPDKWNFWAGFDDESAEKGIIHYIGSSKPWSSSNKAFRDEWLAYAKGITPPLTRRAINRARRAELKKARMKTRA